MTVNMAEGLRLVIVVAVADNGVRIMVPPFIETGTRIVVKIEDATYVERAKD